MPTRSEAEWNAIVDDAIRFLQDQARLGRLTSYTEVNAALGQRGHKMFDFSHESERRAIGAVLSSVTRQTIGDSGAMLSAIVVYLDQNDAGAGFYSLACDLGLLAKDASPDDRLGFWSGQVRKVHEIYARPRRRRRTPETSN